MAEWPIVPFHHCCPILLTAANRDRTRVSDNSITGMIDGKTQLPYQLAVALLLDVSRPSTIHACRHQAFEHEPGTPRRYFSPGTVHGGTNKFLVRPLFVY